MISPPISLPEACTLCAVAVVAGLINAIAGGGTLLTFPTLLYLGIAPVVANATNTVALFLGTGGSLFSLRRHMAPIRAWLIRFLPLSLIGGWLGSVLLTSTSERLFEDLVPFLILFATLIFLSQGALRRLVGHTELLETPPRRLLWLAMGLQFGVAVYGGYFGAGIGILMLASLGLLGWSDINQMNAAKNALAAMINLVASTWFVASDLIDWPRAGILTVGAVVGYFLGAHYSQRVPPQYVRRTVVAIGLGIALVEFTRQFVL